MPSIALIFFTLRATQAMGKDTRRVGEAQVRAYLHLTGAVVTFDPLSRSFIAKASVHNTGNSPAISPYIVVRGHVAADGDIQEVKMGPVEVPLPGIEAGGFRDTAEFLLWNSETSECGAFANIFLQIHWIDVFGKRYQNNSSFALAGERVGSEVIFRGERLNK